MSAAPRQWHKHVLKPSCEAAWLEPHRYPRCCACICPGHMEMLMRVQLVFTETTSPTPSFVSVLFHHQLHPRKPKGAGVTHRGREGLRWMGGCDFTCQVCQMWTQMHSNDEWWWDFVENVIKWCYLVSTFVCYSYRNLANEHESLMQKYLHLLQIVETEKTVAKQLRQQIEDGEIEIERLKSEVILTARHSHWWDGQAQAVASFEYDVLECFQPSKLFYI